MKEFIEPCIEIAQHAGEVILNVYHQDDIQLFLLMWLRVVDRFSYWGKIY